MSTPEKPRHTRCPKCGHHWSVIGEKSEVARQKCDDCGWFWLDWRWEEQTAVPCRPLEARIVKTYNA